MKKIYLQPKLNIVEINMTGSLLDTSAVVTHRDEVPSDPEYDPREEGVDNGWGEWNF